MSDSRAMAVLSRRPERIEVDGEVRTPPLYDSGGDFVIALPRGQHVVNVK